MNVCGSNYVGSYDAICNTDGSCSYNCNACSAAPTPVVDNPPVCVQAQYQVTPLCIAENGVFSVSGQVADDYSVTSVQLSCLGPGTSWYTIPVSIPVSGVIQNFSVNNISLTAECKSRFAASGDTNIAAVAIDTKGQTSCCTQGNNNCHQPINILRPPTGLVVSCTDVGKATVSWTGNSCASAYAVVAQDSDGTTTNSIQKLGDPANTCGPPADSTYDLCRGYETGSSLQLETNMFGRAENENYSWWMHSNNTSGWSAGSGYGPAFNCAAKTCSINSATVNNVTGEVTISFSGDANKSAAENVNAYIARQDGARIDPVPVGTVESSGGAPLRYYYKVNTCSSSGFGSCSSSGNTVTLPDGSYYVHCDLPTAPLQCSGNPVCDYKGGSYSSYTAASR